LKSAELLARVKTHLDLLNARRALALSNEQLKEHNEHQKQTFSILSHDLRGPISSVGNLLDEMADSLGTGFDPVEFRSLLDETRQSVSHISKLIEDVLDWARVQMNAIRFDPQEFLLTECVYSVFDIQMSVSE